MSVKTYSLAKDGDTKLSENFTVREFRCKDGSDRILISPQTVKILQSVRDYFEKSVHIMPIGRRRITEKSAEHVPPSTSKERPAILS